MISEMKYINLVFILMSFDKYVYPHNHAEGKKRTSPSHHKVSLCPFWSQVPHMRAIYSCDFEKYALLLFLPEIHENKIICSLLYQMQNNISSGCSK